MSPLTPPTATSVFSSHSRFFFFPCSAQLDWKMCKTNNCKNNFPKFDRVVLVKSGCLHWQTQGGTSTTAENSVKSLVFIFLLSRLFFAAVKSLVLILFTFLFVLSVALVLLSCHVLFGFMLSCLVWSTFVRVAAFTSRCQNESQPKPRAL